jgi:hypothetical protein
MNLFLHLLLAVRADIPVHCEKPDMVGTWKITESTKLHTEGVGRPWCGLNAPNTNQENLDHDAEAFVAPDTGNSFHVSLLESQYVTKGRHVHMMANTDDWPGHGHGGHEWTTTYDEGLQIFMRHQGEGTAANASLLETGRQSQFKRETHYFALSKYECLEGNPHCGKNGDGESSTGETAGYRSFCGQVVQGWLYRPSYHVNGQRVEEEHGCWVGHIQSEAEIQAHKEAQSAPAAGLLGKDVKIRSALLEPGNPGHPDHPEHPRNKVHAVVFVDDVEDPAGVLGQSMKMHTSYHHRDFEDGLPHHTALLDLHQDNLDKANFKQDEWTHSRRAGIVKRKKYSSKTMMHFRDTCEAENAVTKGKTASLIEGSEERGFDWRHQMGNKWNVAVLNQGACGSCYHAATSYMIGSRFNIEMHRDLMAAGVPFEHLPDPITVSTHALLGCSWHNQGCQGGYPFLSAKHVAEWGAPLESYTPDEVAHFNLPEDGCMPYGSAGMGQVQACNKQCYAEKGKRAQDHLIRVKEYGYLGGPYGVCGQERIMDEIRTHGVVVAALEVDHSGHFSGARPNEVVDPGSFLEFQEQHKSGKAFEHTVHTPGDHSRHDPQSSVQLLEAKWGVKEEDGCKSSVSAEDVNEKMADFPGYQPQEGDSRAFGMNSDWMPNDMDRPFDDAKAALANAMGIDAGCVQLTMVPGALNGWEYTNHAITFVGYGTDDEQRDYWIVRNSWGPDYADNGHSFVPRGIDWGGLDSQIVTAQIDKETGYFKHAFDKHLKAWKELDPAQQKMQAAQQEGSQAASILSPVLLEVDSAAESVEKAPEMPTMSRLFPPLRHANTLIRNPQQRDVRPVRDAATTYPTGESMQTA